MSNPTIERILNLLVSMHKEHLNRTQLMILLNLAITGTASTNDILARCCLMHNATRAQLKALRDNLTTSHKSKADNNLPMEHYKLTNKGERLTANLLGLEVSE